ncbi:hypothetical protein Tco_1101269 [Tanacetum coccineum]
MFMTFTASNVFHIYGRVTWVDIEGIPLKVWTNNTFNRIASKWGELLHVECQDKTSFHRKRVCIKTNLVQNIFESFKIITQGKVLWVRAKEVSGWVPDFAKKDEKENDIDDEIKEEWSNEENVEMHKYTTLEGENNEEEVPGTIFEKEQSKSQNKDDLTIGQNDTHS